MKFKIKNAGEVDEFVGFESVNVVHFFVESEIQSRFAYFLQFYGKAIIGDGRIFPTFLTMPADEIISKTLK